MQEAEIKLRCPPGAAGELRQRLASGGFREERVCRQVDRYYNHPSRDFFRTDEALRLRTVTGGGAPELTELTYKSANRTSDGQLREELELAVASGDIMETILLRLGFVPAAVVDKRRRSFCRGNVTVCEDEVEGLGSFVEIECLSQESDAAAPDVVRAVREELGLSALAQEDRTYLELLLRRE